MEKDEQFASFQIMSLIHYFIQALDSWTYFPVNTIHNMKSPGKSWMQGILEPEKESKVNQFFIVFANH